MEPSTEAALGNGLIIFNILIQADYDTVLNYCRTQRAATEICRDSYFWQEKALLILNVAREYFKQTRLSPAQRYLELASLRGYVTFGSEKYIPVYSFAKYAVRLDRPDLVDYILNLDRVTQNANNLELVRSFLLSAYAEQGNFIKVNEFMSSWEDYYRAAYGALKGNHKELFDHILRQAAVDFEWYLDILLSSALESRNLELYDYVKSLIPADYPVDNTILVNMLLVAAVKSNNSGYFNDLLISVHTRLEINWNSLASAALNKNNLDFFNYIRSWAPQNYNWHWDNLIESTILNSNLTLFDYIYALAPPNYNWDWDSMIYNIIYSSDSGLLYHVYLLLPQNFDWNYAAGLAVNFDKKYFLEYILALMPGYEWNWQYIFSQAIRGGSFESIQSLAPPDYPWNWQELIDVAHESRNTEAVDYLISLQ